MTDESEVEHGTEDSGDEQEADHEVPPDVVDEVERLTRLARDAVDESEAEAYRDERATLLSEYEFRARVREDDEGPVLVLHPDEWLADGLVQVDRIEDVDRGIERPLDGPGDAEDWDAVERYNRAVVQRVADEHGEPHESNAAAFADFMSNHYARPLDDAEDGEVEEFVREYFPRNAWPTDEQRDAVEESVALALDAAESIEPGR